MTLADAGRPRSRGMAWDDELRVQRSPWLIRALNVVRDSCRTLTGIRVVT